MPKEKTWLTAKIFTASSRSCKPLRHSYVRASSLPRAISSLTAVPRHVYRRAAVSDEALEKNDGVRMQE